jgi:N6-adenosine-specific RNA methylase IME4
MTLTNNTQQYTIHPYAQALPAMSAEEQEALKASIQRNGLQHPILLYKNQILDGRHRYQACLDLGIEPDLVAWQGNDNDALAHVMAMNVNRRNLSVSQRALMAAMASNLGKGNNKSRLVAAGHNPADVLTQEDASKLFGVSRDSVQTARYILNNGDPVLIGQVERGEITVNYAKEKLGFKRVGTVLTKDERSAVKVYTDLKRRHTEKLRADQQAKHAELSARNASLDFGDKRFPLIYADPAWAYGKRLAPNEKAIDKHYPTMDIEAIKALPVKDVAAADATLFLWCTAPRLADGLAVMEAWGFNYVTHVIWHKKGGKESSMGGMFRVNHELVLIGHRGKGLGKPDTQLMRSSVFVEPARQHSQKPESFREILEAYYPQTRGARLELFHRSNGEPTPDGWDVWGNQADSEQSAAEPDLLKAA